jgi:hypothetical protein
MLAEVPMNVTVLITSIVRQNTVLLAQLATTAGLRAPLTHLADQVFLDLVTELKRQGLGHRVIADMFGMALRTYHDRLKRLAESRTEGGRSLWEVLSEFIQTRGTVRRADVLRRFHNDDEATVRGMLKDLVASGIVFQSGRGDHTAYRAASAEDLSLATQGAAGERLANLVWVAVNRFGPATAAELGSNLTLELDALQPALQVLLADGRVSAREMEGELCYECQSCVIPLGADSGWEAAVFDHYQAMVTALCSKLRRGRTRAKSDDWIGGSTYGFDVWPGHPHRDEVLNLLASYREKLSAIREQVDAYNAANDVPEDQRERVISYFGQTILGLDERETDVA